MDTASIRALPHAHRQLINANSDHIHIPLWFWFSFLVFISICIIYEFLCITSRSILPFQCEMKTHVSPLHVRAFVYLYLRMKSYILKMLFVELMKCSWKWRMKHLKFVLIIYSLLDAITYTLLCFNYSICTVFLFLLIKKKSCKIQFDEMCTWWCWCCWWKITRMQKYDTPCNAIHLLFSKRRQHSYSHLMWMKTHKYTGNTYIYQAT